MDKVEGKLTVFFDEPFWVGVFEKICAGKLSAAKVVFGAEPKDGEVYEFILKKYMQVCFSPAVAAEKSEKRANPKRMQRNVWQTLLKSGAGTKSQQALQLFREQEKFARKASGRERKLCGDERRFELKQQKKKEKHKGH